MSQTFSDGSVRISQDELLGGTARTQGGLPHLIQYLWDEYAKHLARQIEERATAGRATVDLETAKKKAPAISFCAWATDYLKENRATENYYVEGNLGIRLTNMDCVCLCPCVEVVEPGTMQESHAVGITQGRSRPDNNGVIDQSDKAFRV